MMLHDGLWRGHGPDHMTKVGDNDPAFLGQTHRPDMIGWLPWECPYLPAGASVIAEERPISY